MNKSLAVPFFGLGITLCILASIIAWAAAIPSQQLAAATFILGIWGIGCGLMGLVFWVEDY